MFRNCLIVICSSVLVACGGGSSSESSTPPDIAPPLPSSTIAGAGIKGPLSHADVKLYRFDSNSAFSKGELVAQATTNSQAAIEGLKVFGDLEAHYVLEFNSTGNTIDVSTQTAPIINSFRTLITAEQIESDTPIYASPLSSLTLAIAKLEMDKGTVLEEALTFAEQRVKSYFGLGLNTEMQFLNARALLLADESSLEEQLKALEVRRAIEGFSMVTSQILSSLSEASLSEDELIKQFALDMDDGALDAIASDESELSYGVEQIQLFESSLDVFELPNTNGLTLKELPQMMVNETSRTLGELIDAPEFLSMARYSTHNHFALKADIDGDGLDNLIDDDDDNDSVLDKDDAFPIDASEYLDTDTDGIGDNKDTDDDGDGYLDSEDAFPLERLEWLDTDQDGIGNNADSDDDNDSVPDVDDALPLDSSETEDTDLDGIGNNKDTDDDGDGYLDSEDAFPLERLEWLDTDQDGIGNNADSDDDNDSVPDVDDALPLDSSETQDTDLDGIGNNKDTDDDGDGYLDSQDDFPLDQLEWVDTDKDGIGNNADSDDDNDGVYDNDDELPLDSAESSDFDKDGIGDIADNDDDNDGIWDSADRIHVSLPQPASFVEDEQFEFKVRGFDVDNNSLMSEEGWHVQYYVYDVEKSKILSFYTDNGLYNAPYINGRQEWHISIPAPSYSGSFTIDVRLYCSREQDGCPSSVEYQQNVDFSVVCTKSECEYEPEPEPGKNISATEAYSTLIDSLVMENGDIVVVHTDYEESNWVSYVSVSTDQGNSWSRVATLPTSLHLGNFLTLDNGAIALIGRCDVGYCLLTSFDNTYWSLRDLVSTTNFANCDVETCDINYLRIKSVEKTDAGEFQVIFGKGGESNYRKQQTYITTTDNFVTWSEPQPIMGEYTVAIRDKIQLPDSTYVAVTYSYEDDQTRILSSVNGSIWEEVKSLGWFDEASLHYDNGLTMLYQNNGEIVKVKLNENYETSEEVVVVENSNRGFSSVMLDPSTFGLFYSLDLNFQTDVFFETYKEE